MERLDIFNDKAQQKKIRIPTSDFAFQTHYTASKSPPVALTERTVLVREVAHPIPIFGTQADTEFQKMKIQASKLQRQIKDLQYENQRLNDVLIGSDRDGASSFTQFLQGMEFDQQNLKLDAQREQTKE